MRILVVEDENKIADAIKKGLTAERFVVDVAYDGEDGLDLALSGGYGVIILDIMLPGIGGIEILEKIRRRKISTPVLILTAKTTTDDKVEGLNLGADDYLPKPFAFEELVARIRALLRRGNMYSGSVLKISDLELDPVNFEVTRAGKKLDLSKKEFALLEYLMRSPNKILSKDKIIAHVWGYDAEILPNTVEVFIGYLRQKVDRNFKDKVSLIKTVRGFGYKINDRI